MTRLIEFPEIVEMMRHGASGGQLNAHAFATQLADEIERRRAERYGRAILTIGDSLMHGAPSREPAKVVPLRPGQSTEYTLP